MSSTIAACGAGLAKSSGQHDHGDTLRRDAGDRRRSAVGNASSCSLPRACPVWALDFQYDQTADGRILKLLHIVDEFTREALAMECQRRIDADRTVATLERLVEFRGRAPEFIRCDNGPELTANALRDWCRFSKTASAYIEPGSPWQNPYVESFNSRVRDELLAIELFSCLAEAKVLVADWQEDLQRAPATLIARHEGPRRVRDRLQGRAGRARCVAALAATRLRSARQRH